MARLVFPDEGSRLVFRMSGAGKPLLSAAAGTATVYADEAGATLADIQTAEGLPISDSVLIVSDASQLPLFLGPDGADTVWVSVDSGPVSPCYARNDDRIDDLADEVVAINAVKTVNGVFPDGAGNVTVAPGAVADATIATKGVVQLAGDLGGTATAPTTPTALHKTGAETKTGVLTLNDKPVVPDATFTLAKLVTTGTASASTVLLGSGAWADRFPLGCAENMHLDANDARTGLPVEHWNTPTSPVNIGPNDIWYGEAV